MALPPTIQTIVELIGHGAAMDLVRELGGREIRVPAAKQGDTWEYLVEIIGPQKAARFHERYRGDELYIALCDRALRADRNRRMVARYDALLAQGHSSRGAVGILVGEFRPISYRTVEMIVNSPSPAGAMETVTQGQLF